MTFELSIGLKLVSKTHISSLSVVRIPHSYVPTEVFFGHPIWISAYHNYLNT